MERDIVHLLIHTCIYYIFQNRKYITTVTTVCYNILVKLTVDQVQSECRWVFSGSGNFTSVSDVGFCCLIVHLDLDFVYFPWSSIHST